MSLENMLDKVDSGEMTKNAVTAYLQVRDTPFALGADGGSSNAIINEGIGGCTRKHLFLADSLKRSGYKVNLGIATFDWRTLPIPLEILSLLKDPVQYHMFLFVKNPRTADPEMQVDATWDRGIEHLGFTVSQWDAITSTPISVPATRLWRQNYTVLKARLVASTTLKDFLGTIRGKQPTPFNDRFNKWLEDERIK